MASIDLWKHSSCSILIWFSANLSYRRTTHLIVTSIRYAPFKRCCQSFLIQIAEFQREAHDCPSRDRMSLRSCPGSLAENLNSHLLIF